MKKTLSPDAERAEYATELFPVVIISSIVYPWTFSLGSQQATAQRSEDEVLYRRVREEMENSIIEKSRLLNDSQSELIHLRREIEVARKAENDLRVANAATQNVVADNTKLQAALDRANGDRARLVHELANLKRRQADQVRAAERVDNTALTERVNDFAAERARRAAYGRPSRRSSS